MTNNKKINEATSDSIVGGKYQAPLSPGLRLFKKQDLQPFVLPDSKYDSAELTYDSYDGSMSTPKKQIRKKEMQARKAANYNKKHPSLSDSDGDVLNNGPIKEMTDKIIKTLKEDLAVWFGTKKKPKGSKQPKGPWVNICRKKEGGGHPPCGRPEASSKGYPKCRAAGVASKMTDAQKRSACQQKRKAEKSDPKIGTGNKPTMVSYKPKKKTNESKLLFLIRNLVIEQIINEPKNKQEIEWFYSAILGFMDQNDYEQKKNDFTGFQTFHEVMRYCEDKRDGITPKTLSEQGKILLKSISEKLMKENKFNYYSNIGKNIKHKEKNSLQEQNERKTVSLKDLKKILNDYEKEFSSLPLERSKSENFKIFKSIGTTLEGSKQNAYIEAKTEIPNRNTNLDLKYYRKIQGGKIEFLLIVPIISS